MVRTTAPDALCTVPPTGATHTYCDAANTGCWRKVGQATLSRLGLGNDLVARSFLILERFPMVQALIACSFARRTVGRTSRNRFVFCTRTVCGSPAGQQLSGRDSNSPGDIPLHPWPSSMAAALNQCARPSQLSMWSVADDGKLLRATHILVLHAKHSYNSPDGFH